MTSRFYVRATLAMLAAVLILVASASAEAGCFKGRRARRAACRVPAGYAVQYQSYQSYQRYQAVPVPTASVAPVVPTGQATGQAAQVPAAVPLAGTMGSVAESFTTWLNTTRAAYGLPPVGCDPNLTAWAAANNARQAASGIGHFVMGPARRQNAAHGQTDIYSVGADWMNSGGHRAALLDPTIRWIGIAQYGTFWTFNGS